MASKEELEKYLENTRADMKILASMAAGRAREAGVDLSEDAKVLLDDVSENCTQAVGQIETRIQSRPFVATGIAFGIGVTLGAFLRR